MNWERINDTMRSAPWTIAKVFVRGVAGYELWHDKQPAMLGRFKSFAEAKAEVSKIAKDAA